MSFNELEFNVSNLMESDKPKQIDTFQFEVEINNPNLHQNRHWEDTNCQNYPRSDILDSGSSPHVFNEAINPNSHTDILDLNLPSTSAS